MSLLLLPPLLPPQPQLLPPLRLLLLRQRQCSSSTGPQCWRSSVSSVARIRLLQLLR
jgi:hypothetical protein